uniref:Coiled-coil domain-containing protein 39 n=1 Tax=Esox lucius TaxID=8010 RepID=A0A3P8Z808_ESOLU
MSNILLSAVGWDEGFAIPVANPENKELEAEALCKAREKETESEKHFKALADRETGRLRQEIAQLDKELDSLREKKNLQENNIFKATQKLDELKSQLNWDQQTLDTWLEESAHKDEDTMAIIKYAQQDESRIRVCLGFGLTRIYAFLIGLDKTAENFRQAHLERQELIGQWENTIEQMKKRDAEMQQCSMLLAQVNKEIRERNGDIKEKKTFLEREVENNKEYEKKISMADRQTAKLRQELQKQESNCVRLQDELESLKGTVDRTATDLETRRSQLANLKKDIQDKDNKVKGAKHQNAALEEKLLAVTEMTLSVEERAAQMEQLLKEEEQTIKDIDAQLHRHREALYRDSQELQSLRLKEKDSVAALASSRVALSNLDSRLSKLDQNTIKQKEIIYNQDFQIQLLERKMARLRGEVNTEEKQVLEEKARELAQSLEEKRRTANMLTMQLKNVQVDNCLCYHTVKEVERTGIEKSRLTAKIEEIHLFNDTSDKELNKLRLKKQDTMVENNITKLELRRLRDLLYNKADSVLSLERRRLQLQTAMGEREEEVQLHRDMLSRQVKISDQERQGLSAEVHERLSKIDKMRKRYEILTATMAAPEGEGERSQAYYVIKAAQEKEELQREGDDLDAKIRKTEKEIGALENTLHVVNGRNATYRKSFSKVTESSEEYQEKLKLEEQKRAVEEKYKYKRRQIRELQEDIQGMNNTLDTLLQEEAVDNEKTNETQSRILSVNKELVSQKEKLDRVTKQCSNLTKEIRSAKKANEETFEEKDIQLRELKNFNKNINKMLLDAMDEQSDLKMALHMYFLQANLTLPSPTTTPASRHSSKTNSARSSLRALDYTDSVA